MTVLPVKKSVSNKLSIETPAYVFDESGIEDRCQFLVQIGREVGFQVLFALKSFSIAEILHPIAKHVSGFAASSVFEARLAKELEGHNPTIHLTSPGIRHEEIDMIAELCDFVSFNSLSQWSMYWERLRYSVSCGLRVNPEISFVGDKRYNPSRKYSKLGVPASTLKQLVSQGARELRGLQGIHIHNNSESRDLSQLVATINVIDHWFAPLLSEIDWFNLGGGYLFSETMDFGELSETLANLHSRYDLDIYIEPGVAIINEFGALHTTVLDIFDSGGEKIAVLDASVNHMPEVFEYQYEPDVDGEVENGKHRYILAGRTCLAGDIFGGYAFSEPLEIGSRIVIANAGAYTFVKAHMFNGINLPTVYTLKRDGRLVIAKRFSYEDYVSRCGERSNVRLRTGI